MCGAVPVFLSQVSFSIEDQASMNKGQSKELNGWIERIMRDFLLNSRENTLRNKAEEKAFEEVLIGFSSGDDPLFEALKDHVGPFHWTPLEIFHQVFPSLSVQPRELTVISWVLPHTDATRADNREENEYPSERWARARVFGEMVNTTLRKHVVERLVSRGIHAVAPLLAPQWEMRSSDKYGIASTWSERHVAYVSGLGTFGLCDGLITPRGKAMRLGSVVAQCSARATPRPYADPHAFCLFFAHGVCGRCIRRCPAGAISKKGHDKAKCREYLRSKAQEYVKTQFGFDGYACGLCQTGVPCESRIPLKEDVSSKTDF
jgi:ferredoxin